MVYFDEKRRIKWPDDWIDPYITSIEAVYIFNDHIKVWKSHEVDLDFMCHAYYNAHVSTTYFLNREYRTRAARFVPAVVKDFNVFLKLSDEVCSKYKLDRFVIDMPDILACSVGLDIANLSDKEVVDRVIRRVEALTELRRRFREWLPSDERRGYYESTMLYPEDPFRERTIMNQIIEWPHKSGDPKKNAEHERWSKAALMLEGRVKPLRKYYNFDGYRLRLARKTGENLEFLGKIIEGGMIVYDEEMLPKEDTVVAVDEKLDKLLKFSLEKIEFLKEDFPEMFK